MEKEVEREVVFLPNKAMLFVTIKLSEKTEKSLGTLSLKLSEGDGQTESSTKCKNINNAQQKKRKKLLNTKHDTMPHRVHKT